jgi:hypothetical protein
VITETKLDYKLLPTGPVEDSGRAAAALPSTGGSELFEGFVVGRQRLRQFKKPRQQLPGCFKVDLEPAGPEADRRGQGSEGSLHRGGCDRDRDLPGPEVAAEFGEGAVEALEPCALIHGIIAAVDCHQAPDEVPAGDEEVFARLAGAEPVEEADSVPRAHAEQILNVSTVDKRGGGLAQNLQSSRNTVDPLCFARHGSILPVWSRSRQNVRKPMSVKKHYPAFGVLYALIMPETVEIREKIRQVLEAFVPAGPEAVEQALDRIMETVDPFERIAREELERYRETFTELAR